MNFNTLLNQYIDTLPIISPNRDYWLVRTQGGSLYETFLNNSFISIEYDGISYSSIERIRKNSTDSTSFSKNLRKQVKETYPNEKAPWIIASQIIRFIYEIKKDDIVIIPSENSSTISIGRVVETPLHIATQGDILKTKCNYLFRKKIKWIKQLNKEALDPYLYKVLFAHQAINNLNHYQEFIERSITNFFIKEGEANLVLEIEKEGKISAKELFTLGSAYLDFFEGLSTNYKLDLSASDIEVKIALNSPGKLHFKAPNIKTLVLFGLGIIAINGGGFTWEKYGIDLSTDGLIQKVIDYQNNEHDREFQDALYSQYKDSLKVQQPDDLIKLLSTNNKKE